MDSITHNKLAGILAGQFACENDPTARLALWRTTLSTADAFVGWDGFDRADFYSRVFGTSDHFAVRDEITAHMGFGPGLPDAAQERSDQESLRDLFFNHYPDAICENPFV